MVGGYIMDRETLVRLLVDRVKQGILAIEQVLEVYRAEVEEKLHE